MVEYRERHRNRCDSSLINFNSLLSNKFTHLTESEKIGYTGSIKTKVSYLAKAGHAPISSVALGITEDALHFKIQQTLD